MQRVNWTTIALIGGLVVLALILLYFMTRGNSEQDKLTNSAASTASAAPPAHEKMCASKSTYDLIKRDLFRRAAQVRGSDQAAYDQLAGYAVLRMDNPVMESEDSSTNVVNCSGSLALDLPPGVAVIGGRRTLTSDVDYTVQPAADGSGMVMLLRNADAIVTPLATLTRTSQPAQQTAAPLESNQVTTEPQEPNAGAAESANKPLGSQPSAAGRPSFDCRKAKSRSEVSVCSDSGLSALDLNMADQYSRALAAASPEQRDLLRETRDRFLRYRDRCPNRKCIGDAYIGRMREIRDIVEGRWQPAR